MLNPVHENNDLKIAKFYCHTCLNPCLHLESNLDYAVFQSLYRIIWFIGTVVSPHVCRYNLLLESRAFCSLHVDYLTLHE